ncbi:MAG: hypothetical protein ACJA0F_001796 [Dinoroseobacter sp.]|jgi:hypothetical protein
MQSATPTRAQVQTYAGPKPEITAADVMDATVDPISLADWVIATDGVHLHSRHSVALSMVPDTDPDDVILALKPYPIMQLGSVELLPFFLPGDPAMGAAVRGLAGKRSAVLLANHDPVVAGRDLEATVP